MQEREVTFSPGKKSLTTVKHLRNTHNIKTTWKKSLVEEWNLGLFSAGSKENFQLTIQIQLLMLKLALHINRAYGAAAVKKYVDPVCQFLRSISFLGRGLFRHIIAIRC